MFPSVYYFRSQPVSLLCRLVGNDHRDLEVKRPEDQQKIIARLGPATSSKNSDAARNFPADFIAARMSVAQSERELDLPLFEAWTKA